MIALCVFLSYWAVVFYSAEYPSNPPRFIRLTNTACFPVLALSQWFFTISQNFLWASKWRSVSTLLMKSTPSAFALLWVSAFMVILVVPRRFVDPAGASGQTIYFLPLYILSISIASTPLSYLRFRKNALKAFAKQ